jgi:hypothetical protein
VHGQQETTEKEIKFFIISMEAVFIIPKHVGYESVCENATNCRGAINSIQLSLN